MSLTLYSYFRSSAAWRTRIALHIKGLPYETAAVHLLRDGGQQKSASYLHLNPQGLVPALVDEEQHVIAQSLAICEYLEERYPTPPLLPSDSLVRAKVRSLAYAIACDIHPINNLRVLQYLKQQMGQAQPAIDDWYRHWVGVGFTAIEAELAASNSQRFCVGDAVSLADICLLPQVFNARRFQLDLSPFPHIVAVEAHLASLPAFADTHPARQPDAE